MEENLIKRVQLLIKQGRFDDAESISTNLLEQNPNSRAILCLCAQVALGKKAYQKAQELINHAIGTTPNEDFFHYVKADVMLQQDKYDESENCLKQAININPYEAHYFSLWASIKLARKQYQKALDLANQSLELDAENILGLNIRSTALLKLNQKEESFRTIDGALKEDPNNAYTHTNYGWNLLEKGDHQKALEHFKEALKSDPDYAYAQAGMGEALKAKYFIYRLFLKYSFWIGNLTAKYQWGVIIGFYFGFKGLRLLATQNEVLAPYLTPLIFLLMVLAFSTWVIAPISNLFLRLNVYGKHLLDRKEILSSNFVGISIILCITGTLAYFFFGEDNWLTVAVYGFTMMVPLSVMFAPSKQKNSLIFYTSGMALVGAIAILTTFITGELFSTYSTIYILGFVGFQWIANFLMIKEDNI